MAQTQNVDDYVGYIGSRHPAGQSYGISNKRLCQCVNRAFRTLHAPCTRNRLIMALYHMKHCYNLI